MPWEYLTVHFDTKTSFFGNSSAVNTGAFDQALNRLGTKDWELVSVVGVQDRTGQTDSIVATLKRPKPVAAVAVPKAVQIRRHPSATTPRPKAPNLHPLNPNRSTL